MTIKQKKNKRYDYIEAEDIEIAGKPRMKLRATKKHDSKKDYKRSKFDYKHYTGDENEECFSEESL